MSDPVLLPLLRGQKISLEDALENDKNMLDQLDWPDELLEFCFHLYTNLSQIEALVSRHLRIPRSAIRVGGFKEWRHGTFNACIPIAIDGPDRLPRQVLIRFPQPYKIGESFNPGNVEEKLRCEAATYIWLQQNCPTIPIPSLLAMGFPGTQSFTALEHASIWERMLWHLRRLWVGPILSPYVSHRRQVLSEVGYLIIEHVEDGEMLSDTWEDHRGDPLRRANLFRGLSKILLSLAKIPLPRIGSWTIDNSGFISLTNRPLALLIHEFESHKIPTNIPRSLTYNSVEPWVLDMLACQDSRMRHQPNAIHSNEDGRTQLSALVGLRALLPNFVDRRAHGGPFVLSFTDLHASNIFVDRDWNITRIIDLEFACVLPLQMVTAPAWLTSRGIDLITGPHLEEYKAMYDEFIDAIEDVEREQGIASKREVVSYGQVLRKAWVTNSFWYSRALFSLNAFPALFGSHILRRFGEELHSEAEEALMKFWSDDATDLIMQKVKDQEFYDAQLRQRFALAKEHSDAPTLAEGESRDVDTPECLDEEAVSDV